MPCGCTSRTGENPNRLRCRMLCPRCAGRKNPGTLYNRPLMPSGCNFGLVQTENLTLSKPPPILHGGASVIAAAPRKIAIMREPCCWVSPEHRNAKRDPAGSLFIAGHPVGRFCEGGGRASRASRAWPSASRRNSGTWRSCPTRGRPTDRCAAWTLRRTP